MPIPAADVNGPPSAEQGMDMDYKCTRWHHRQGLRPDRLLEIADAGLQSDCPSYSPLVRMRSRRELCSCCHTELSSRLYLSILGKLMSDNLSSCRRAESMLCCCASSTLVCTSTCSLIRHGWVVEQPPRILCVYVRCALPSPHGDQVWNHDRLSSLHTAHHETISRPNSRAFSHGVIRPIRRLRSSTELVRGRR